MCPVAKSITNQSQPDIANPHVLPADYEIIHYVIKIHTYVGPSGHKLNGPLVTT